MTLQSRIWISIGGSLAVSILVAFLVFCSIRGIGEDLARGRRYNDIIQKAFALNTLVTTGARESDERHLQQFGEVRASLTKLLDGLASTDAREEALIRQIRRNSEELGPLLDQFLAQDTEPDDLQAELKKMLATQLWIKVRFISDDTSRLMGISESRIVSAYTQAGITVFFLLTALIAANVIISWLSGRSIVRMQEGLRKQREWLRVTLTSIGDAVVATDEESRVTFLNPVAESLTGWKAEEIVGRPLANMFRLIDEQTGRPMEPPVARVLGEGRAVSLSNHAALLARDGRVVPIEDSAAPILDDTGKVIGAVLVFHDVSEKRRAAEALRQTENRYRALFEGMTEGFALHEIICDEKGVPCDFRFLEINPAFERLTGLKREDVLNRTLNEVLPNEDPKWVRLFGEAALTGKSIHFDNYSPILKRHYEVFAYSPAPRQVGVLFMDITDRKQAEIELQQKTLELEQLNQTLEARVRERTEELAGSQNRLQNLSSQLLLAQEKERKRVAIELHDGLLSELAGVKYMVEGRVMLLEKGNAPDINDLKRVASILAGVMKEARGIMNNLHPTILDELGLIAVMNWLSGEYEKSYPHIKVKKKIEVVEREILDPLKVVIYRILQEALNNFAKHGNGNLVEISLSKPDGAFALRIRDNGKGFDPKKAKRGLGLESMRERVELSGGEFYLESVIGQGTTIQAIWPLRGSPS